MMLNRILIRRPIESGQMAKSLHPILTILTFGIYFFWVIPSLNKWVVEHTDFADEAKPEGDLV